MESAELNSHEEVHEHNSFKTTAPSRKRVSLKSSRLWRKGNGSVSAGTRHRKASHAPRPHRKATLHHLFEYDSNEHDPEANVCIHSGIASVVARSRRLSEAVAKIPTFTTVETTTGRRRSEPYSSNMFTALLKPSSRNKKISLPTKPLGVKISPTEVLMLKNDRKLEALAANELLACLNSSLHEDYIGCEVNHSTSFGEQVDIDRIIIDGDYIPEEENQKRIKERKRREEKQTRVITELLQTEKNYVTCLSILHDVFKKPLESEDIVSPKDLTLIFPSTLNEIQSSHETFMNDLENDILGHWQISGVCELLATTTTNLLDIYTRYMTSFPRAISTLTKYTRGSNKFRKFLDHQYSNPLVERLDLPSFLLSPVQRLPRYVLLLAELNKCTSVEHPDKECIGRTKKGIEEVISSLDTSVKGSSLDDQQHLSDEGKKGRFINRFSKKKVTKE